MPTTKTKDDFEEEWINEVIEASSKSDLKSVLKEKLKLLKRPDPELQKAFDAQKEELLQRVHTPHDTYSFDEVMQEIKRRSGDNS